MKRMNDRVVLSLCSTFLAAICVAPASGQFRTIDGTGNNPLDTNAGSAGVAMLRLVPADYPDDIGTLFGSSVNPRTISNFVFDQNGSLLNQNWLSSGVWQWGQFIDHDFALTTNDAAHGTAHIFVNPATDPDGMSMIPMNRTLFDPSTGDVAGNPRQQVNSVTSYIDGSQVYGSDPTRAAALRDASGGTLKVSAGNFLPLANQDAQLGALFMDDGGIPNQSPLFVAGDIRANEQPGLTAMHTLFVREHNRIALGLACTGRTDEEIYQTARKVVGAEIQRITYNEFLPMLLGPSAPSAVVNLASQPDATMMNEFTTVGFRVGHTMLNPSLLLADQNGILPNDLELRDAFFRPQDVFFDNGTPKPDMVDQVLLGLAKQTSEDIDAKIVDDVRSFMFTPGGGPGIDLGALNIQRGREHGLPSYNDMRLAFGLTAAAGYGDISSDASVAQELESAYGVGNIGDVDAFVGALAEDHLLGANVGELINAILVEQFTRLRDGDSFFYSLASEQSILTDPDVLALVDVGSVELADIIMMNTGMNSPDMPFGFFTTVPEPATVAILSLVVGGLAFIRRRS